MVLVLVLKSKVLVLVLVLGTQVLVLVLGEKSLLTSLSRLRGLMMLQEVSEIWWATSVKVVSLNSMRHSS